MKTIESVIHKYPSGMPYGGYSYATVEKIVQEYGKELLKHLMENSREYIYIDDGDGTMPDEAVFDYSQMMALSDNLK